MTKTKERFQGVEPFNLLLFLCNAADGRLADTFMVCMIYIGRKVGMLMLEYILIFLILIALERVVKSIKK